MFFKHVIKQTKTFFMQKTTTLKDFKVKLLRTILSIFVLGISFQVSIGQELQRTKGKAVPLPFTVKQQNAVAAKVSATDVPEINQRMTGFSGATHSISSNPILTLGQNRVEPTSNIVDDVCTFNGSLVSGDLTLTNGRFFRDGVPSACGATKVCPGPFGTGPYYYDTYSLVNGTCQTQCVTVNYIANAGGGDVFVVAYNGSFNPTNLCTNYMADGGSSSLSGGAAVTFNVTVAANTTVIFVAMAAQISTACPSYTMTVTGLNCTPPPPGCSNPITASVLSQVQVPAAPVNLINEGFNTVIPAGWAAQNNSQPVGLTNWFQGNAGVFPANTGAATSYIATNFNNTTGANTISNWLFPPSVLMKNGDQFKFYTRTVGAPAFPDRLQVRMNTTNTGTNVGATNTSVGDFTTLLLDINPTYTTSGYPSAWTQYTITLSGLPAGGVNGRLAFRYFVENGGPAGANSDYIGIDDVVYTTLANANPNTCTGSTANLKVDITAATPGGTYNLVLNANPPGGPGGNFTVNNYTSGANIPVTPPVTTTYSIVSVTSATDPCCIGTGNSGTPTIVVSPLPIATVGINALPDPPLCAGNPTLLTAVQGTPLVNYCFTQSTSTAVISGNSVACNAGGITTDNSYWRVYDLATYGLPGPLTINQIKFGVELNANGPFNVTANFYVQTGAAFPAGTRTLVRTQVISVPNQALTIFSAPITPFTVNPTDKIVVELFTPGTATSRFFIGSNSAAQTGTTYLSAAPCGIPTPTDIAVIGFPNMHIILDFCGTTGGATSPLPAGWTVLWSPAAGLSNPVSNPVAASPMTTTTYQVLVTATNGCQTTAQKLITVNQLPAVVTNPTDVTVCTGQNATFSVTGTGAGLTYQWQVSTAGPGGPWNNVTNGGVYAGATTATLTLTNIPVGFNNNRYRCVISGTCPPAATSTNALLTVNALPTVTISPASPVCGGVAGINGTALTASGASTYVWAPLTGLYTNATATIAYTGGNAATVYAAPVQTTIYTVNGTAAGTGCQNSASIKVLYTPPAPTVVPTSVTMCLGDPAVKLKSSSSTSTNIQFCSGPISIPIPDNNPAGANHTIPVSGIPAGAFISNMSVTWTLPHTWNGDMTFVLKAPNGNILNLDYYLSATGGAGVTTGFVNTKISSTGTNAISSGTGTYTGTFRADAVTAAIAPFGAPGPTGFLPTGNTWTQLYSVPNGNYTLAMYDGGGLDLGTLTSWCIDITYVTGVPATPAVWAPAAGLFSDASASTPYVAGTAVDSVWTRPTPSGVYNYTATVRGLPEPDPANLNPIVINDAAPGSPYPAIISVSGFPTTGVSVAQVKLNGVAHTWGDDIDILLQSPTGQNVVLMSDVGGTVAVPNATYTFDDAGPAMAAGAANPTGTYHVTNNGATDNWAAPLPATFTQAAPALSLFGSVANVNGDWKLFVMDDVGGDFGNISGGYSIKFSPPIQGCLSPSRTIVVTVNDKAVVTQQPVNRTICTDGTTTFTVVATGSAPLSYQWQVSTDNGNTFSNISNNTIYSGATTATLTVTRPPVSFNGNFYRVLVQSALPCANTPSFFVRLTVNPLPTIVISASPYVKLFPGLITTLSSTVSPVAAQTYQWIRNGVNVSGGNAGTLSVDVDGLGDYQLRVTDVNGCTNISNTVNISDSVSANCFLYPNPSNGRFQVRYHSVANNVLPRSVTIYDSKGTRVMTQRFTIVAPYARMDVDLRPYGKGVYWVEIGDLNGTRITMCRAVVD